MLSLKCAARLSSPKGALRTERYDHSLVVIPFGNQFDLRYAELESQIEEIKDTILERDLQQVVVDCGEIGYLSSTVIGALIEVWEFAVEQGCQFVVCDLSETALETLVAVRLDTRWPFYPIRQLALQSRRSD